MGPAPLKILQVGGDSGKAAASIAKAKVKADIRMLVQEGRKEAEGMPPESFCDLLSAKVEREYEVVVIPATSEDLVLAMYMAVESAVTEGGCVMVTEMDAVDRAWLFTEMIKEGVVRSYPDKEERGIAVFRHNSGKLDREL